MSDRNKKPADTGLPAGEWINAFRGAKVEVERLDAAKSEQWRATIIGNFLARMVDRQVPIEVDGRTGWATLRKAPARAHKQLYYFEVTFGDGQNVDDDRTGDDPQPTGKKVLATRKRPQKELKKPAVESRDSPIDRTPAPGLVPAGNDEAW